MGVALEVAQEDYLLVLLRQAVQGIPYSVKLQPRIQGRAVLGLELFQLRLIFQRRFPGFSASFPEFIHSAVMGNVGYSGRKFGFQGIKGPAVTPDGQDYVLGHLFCVVAVSEKSHGQREHFGRIPVIQSRQGLLIPGRDQCGQLGVLQDVVVHGLPLHRNTAVLI
jgi:hypothetical protein